MADQVKTWHTHHGNYPCPPLHSRTHGNGLPISDCILSWMTPLWATPDSLLNNADAPLKLLLVCTLAWFHGITVELSTFCIPCTAFAVRRACIGTKLTHALWCNLAEPRPGQDKTRLLVSYKIGETNRLSETLRQMTAYKNESKSLQGFMRHRTYKLGSILDATA